MVTSWQITCKIIWYHIRKDGTGVLLVLLLIAAIVGVFWQIGERITSPVVAKTKVTGTIQSVQLRQTDPAAGVGGGFSYKYGIRLNEDEKLVFASKRAQQPKRIGDDVVLIRAARENGLVTYRFAPVEHASD